MEGGGSFVPGWASDLGVAPREKPFPKANKHVLSGGPFFDRISMWTFVMVVMMVVLKSRFRLFSSYR